MCGFLGVGGFFLFFFLFFLLAVLLFVFTCNRGRLGPFQILDNHRDSPVARIGRIFWITQTLIGEAAKLFHLIGAQAVVLHDVPRRVGPIRRKLPICVIAAIAERLGVGVSFNDDIIRQLP